jgi:hypothetical protein
MLDVEHGSMVQHRLTFERQRQLRTIQNGFGLIPRLLAADMTVEYRDTYRRECQRMETSQENQ